MEEQTGARVGPYVPPEDVYTDEPRVFPTIRRDYNTEIVQGPGFWSAGDSGRVEFTITPDRVARVTLLEGVARTRLLIGVLSLGYPVFVVGGTDADVRGGYDAVFIGDEGRAWNSVVRGNRLPQFVAPLPDNVEDGGPLPEPFDMEMVDRDRLNRVEQAHICIIDGEQLGGMTLEERAQHIVDHGDTLINEFGLVTSQEYLRVEYEQFWNVTPMDGECTCPYFVEKEVPCKHLRAQRIWGGF